MIEHQLTNMDAKMRRGLVNREKQGEMKNYLGEVQNRLVFTFPLKSKLKNGSSLSTPELSPFSVL